MQFQAQLENALATGPLYRKVAFRSSVFTNTDKSGTRYNSQFVPLPSAIRMFCPHAVCKRDSIWDITSRAQLYPTRDLHFVKYECRHCTVSFVDYALHVEIEYVEGQPRGFVMKAGQWPALCADVPSDLKLGVSDSDLYRKAVLSRNAGFGIGAIAYLRRVVENSLNMLCDKVIEVYKLTDPNADADALKRQRWENKTEFAKSHLPEKLTRGGHNPLGILVTFTSEALHEKTDEECGVRFDEIRTLFELTYRSLEFEMKEAEEYAKVFGKFTGEQDREVRGKLNGCLQTGRRIIVMIVFANSLMRIGRGLFLIYI